MGRATHYVQSAVPDGTYSWYCWYIEVGKGARRHGFVLLDKNGRQPSNFNFDRISDEEIGQSPSSFYKGMNDCTHHYHTGTMVPVPSTTQVIERFALPDVHTITYNVYESGVQKFSYKTQRFGTYVEATSSTTETVNTQSFANDTCFWAQHSGPIGNPDRYYTRICKIPTPIFSSLTTNVVTVVDRVIIDERPYGYWTHSDTSRTFKVNVVLKKLQHTNRVLTSIPDGARQGYSQDATSISYDSALDQLYEGFNFNPVNNFENIVSLLNLKKDIQNVGKSLSKLFKGKDSISRVSSLADLYLAKKYAVDTTLLDAKETITFIDRLRFKGAPIVRSANVRETNPNGSVSRTILMRCNSVTQSIFEELGFSFNASNLWDTLPMSFVLDWFVNVGNLLEQLDKQTVLDTRVHINYLAETVIYNAAFTGLVDGWLCNIQYRYYSRSSLAYLPTYSLSTKSNLSSHGDTGSALLISLLNNKRK